MDLDEARELKNEMVRDLQLVTDEPTYDQAVEPPRTIFEGVRIAVQHAIFTPELAEQDAAGWWFEWGERPTFVPHHAVHYIQFTHEDDE